MILPPSEPPAPAPPDDDLRIAEPLCAVFRRTLKSVGLKYTPERARILDAVVRWDETHPAAAGVFHADQLLASMQSAEPSVSKATVYRTIKLLADAGIIQQVLFDAETAHYQLAYNQRASGLLVDVSTGALRSVSIPELNDILARVCAAHGLTPQGCRLVLYAQSAPTADDHRPAPPPAPRPTQP